MHLCFSDVLVRQPLLFIYHLLVCTSFIFVWHEVKIEFQRVVKVMFAQCPVCL